MQLILVDPRSGRRKSFALGSEPLRIGSAVDCDVVLPDDGVGAHALKVVWSADGVVLESVDGSSFLLNGNKAKAALLHPGDVVNLGAFQLVVAPSAEAPPPRPAAATPPRAESRRASETLRITNAAARREEPKAGTWGWFVLLFVVAVGGGLAWSWYAGLLDPVIERVRAEIADRGDKPSKDATDKPPTDDGTGVPSTESGDEAADGERADGAGGKTAGVGAGSRSGSADAPNKSAESAEIDVVFAKVALLLKNDEFARSRWLLSTLRATGSADRARVEAMRAEVDTLTQKAGAAHLAFVEKLATKGNIAAALSNCVEESIGRFRGTETWYALLEKADEIEAIIAERVPDEFRIAARRKHAHPRPANLATMPPPPVDETFAEELSVGPKRAAGSPNAEGAKPLKPQPPGDRPADPAKPATTESAEAATTPAALVAAFAALDAAKPAAFAARLADMVEAAGDAGAAAVAPLTARVAAIGAQLGAAPEKAALAAVRAKCESLRATREVALAYLFDRQLYFMLDPKASADVSRGDELAKAQKEADRLVDAVRKEWGSELGSAPAPLVNFSDGYARMVREVQTIDLLLQAQKAPLPDQFELLSTRLLPSWSSKVHVRNYALDLAERDRIDRDRDLRTANQRLRDVDGDALELLVIMNAYREMLGRPQLPWDAKLATSAQLAATDLAKTAKTFKESDPQPLPEPRTDKDGGIAFLRGKFSARQALQTWCRMATAHRHILDLEHRSLGIGVEPKYWVAKFGKFVPAAPR